MLTEPQLIDTAAENVAEVRSAIGAAKAAAAGPTTRVAAAAADEVSAAAAKLFGSYAREYQAVLNRAAAFHDDFAAALTSAANAYTAAEAANASAISGALGGTGGTATPMVVQPSLQGTTIGLIMGGAGEPIPLPSSITEGRNYLNQIFTVLPSDAVGLVTPASLYPLTGVKSLTLDASVAQGVQILDSAIKNTLATNASGSVAVFGPSESAIVSSLEMENLANPLLNPSPPTANQLGFVLVGDQMNPNGGILARFPGLPAGQPLQLPSLGITFYGATPSNTIYPTNIYSMEYDGFADFPQYPINVVSDLNAFAGILHVHNAYPGNPSAPPPGYNIQQLPTSPGYTGVTNYYMITTQNGLPLLDPVRGIPVIGNPIADLLQPDLTTIVNLGYGSPTQGWSMGYANDQTYFGLFPHVSQALIAKDLIVGAQQGTHAFVSDIHAETSGVSLASVSHSLTSALSAPSLSPDGIIETIQGTVTNVANGISSAAASLYAAALPTADIVNAVVTVIPAYDLNLFLSGIQQALDGNVLGGLQYAFVAPIAATTGLLTLAGGFELLVVVQALAGA
jgi:hypothetical protein